MLEEISWDDMKYILTLKYGQYFSSGLDRIVFKTKNGVCKLARNDKDYVNIKEESIYQMTRNNKNNDSPRVAKCRTIYIKGHVLLMMEWVTPWYEVDENISLPDWCGYVDGQQVGFNKKGELVAYDAAY